MERKVRRRVALATVLVSGLCGVLAFTVCAPTTRKVVARSIRAAVGPPAPPEVDQNPALPESRGDPGSPDSLENSADPDTDRPDGAAPVVVPAPEAPVERPRRPRGLRGVSYVLLLGMDNRTEKVTGRTDTMVIGAFRHRDGKVAAFSIPRDLWVEIPDLGPARLSSVVRIGNYKLGPGRGVPLLRQVIRDEFGIRIDRHAAIDLEKFVALVDGMGGIDVDVQCPIADCFWTEGPPEEGHACEMMRVEAGRQHMDGSTALKFARSRHGRGDRDRTKRQQAVLVAFGRAVARGGLSGLRRLWEVAEPHILTDLEWDSAAYYASFGLEADLRAIGGFSITRPIVERHVTEDGKHVLLLDPAEFERALSNLFETRLPGLRERTRCPDVDVALNGRPRG